MWTGVGPSFSAYERRRAGLSARPRSQLAFRQVALPVTARARALVGRRAVVRLLELARRLGDGERVVRATRVRLRRGGDRVARLARRVHVHLTGAGAHVETGVGDVGLGVTALRVVLSLREARLDGRNDVSSIGLGGGVLALLTLAEEGRQRDRGEDDDDEDHDQELDQREAPVVVLNTVAEVPQHLSPPFEVTGSGGARLP